MVSNLPLQSLMPCIAHYMQALRRHELVDASLRALTARMLLPKTLILSEAAPVLAVIDSAVWQAGSVKAAQFDMAS